MTNTKPKRAPRPAVAGRSVLVLSEKHGSRYFVVDNDQELHAASLVILRGRLKSGYYYFDPGPPPEGPGYHSVEGLPDSLRPVAKIELSRHQHKAAMHAREKSQWEAINLACSSADGRMAWDILVARSDHEYERVSLETVCTSYNP